MEKINKFLSKYYILAILIFALFTLFIALIKVPFWDETHAFDIACLKISEIFQLAKVEGHTVFWYLILKPFTNFQLYPYSMIFINWFFCVFALVE